MRILVLLGILCIIVNLCPVIGQNCVKCLVEPANNWFKDCRIIKSSSDCNFITFPTADVILTNIISSKNYDLDRVYNNNPKLSNYTIVKLGTNKYEYKLTPSYRRLYLSYTFVGSTIDQVYGETIPSNAFEVYDLGYTSMICFPGWTALCHNKDASGRLYHSQSYWSGIYTCERPEIMVGLDSWYNGSYDALYCPKLTYTASSGKFLGFIPPSSGFYDSDSLIVLNRTLYTDNKKLIKLFTNTNLPPIDISLTASDLRRSSTTNFRQFVDTFTFSHSISNKASVEVEAGVAKGSAETTVSYEWGFTNEKTYSLTVEDETQTTDETVTNIVIPTNKTVVVSSTLNYFQNYMRGKLCAPEKDSSVRNHGWLDAALYNNQHVYASHDTTKYYVFNMQSCITMDFIYNSNLAINYIYETL